MDEISGDRQRLCGCTLLPMSLARQREFVASRITRLHGRGGTRNRTNTPALILRSAAGASRRMVQ
ncbi:hypothetical protein IP69_16855 [Bosea sp. AAP35]|nr:hypothetical protein IP69_16855 [Bosea sp. AAP35]